MSTSETKKSWFKPNTSLFNFMGIIVSGCALAACIIILLDAKRASYDNLVAIKGQLLLQSKENAQLLKDKEIENENYITQLHYQDSVEKNNSINLQQQYGVIKMQFDSEAKQDQQKDSRIAEQFKYQDRINSLNLAANKAQLAASKAQVEALKMQANLYKQQLIRDSLLKDAESKSAIAKFDISVQKVTQKFTYGKLYNLNIHITNSGKKDADSLYGLVYILNLKSQKVYRVDTINNANLLINQSKDFQVSKFARTQEFGLIMILQYKDFSSHLPQPVSIYMMRGMLGHFYFPSMKVMNKFYDIIKYPADKRTYQLY